MRKIELAKSVILHNVLHDWCWKANRRANVPIKFTQEYHRTGIPLCKNISSCRNCCTDM